MKMTKKRWIEFFRLKFDSKPLFDGSIVYSNIGIIRLTALQNEFDDIHLTIFIDSEESNNFYFNSTTFEKLEA